MSRVVCGIFLALLVSFSVYGQNLALKPVGHINDFANILDSQTKQNLETKLRKYRDKTSIEVAVVTVASLEGLTVEQYTLNIAQRWGVGNKKKDTGIVLLIAPNERKMRIEVGYGIEPDLTDSQAGRIIQNTIIPYFKESVQQTNDIEKNKKLTEGILAGVTAILAGLGDAPYQARFEERKIAQEKALMEQKRRNEQTAIFLKLAGLVLLVLLVIGAIALLAYKIISRRRFLKNKRLNNMDDLKKSESLISEALDEYPKAVDKLEELKKISPKSIWIEFEKPLKATRGLIKASSEELGSLIVLSSNLGWRKSEEVAPKIANLLARVLVLANIFDHIALKIEEVQKAEKESPKLLDKIPEAIDRAKKDIDHKDVSKRSQAYLDQAKDTYQKAKELVRNSSVDWLSVIALATAAMTLISNAKNVAKSDIANAEEARRPKPKRRSSDYGYGSGYSSGWSSRSSSGSSDSGSSFGGFGGGGFGGGGASGSW